MLYLDPRSHDLYLANGNQVFRMELQPVPLLPDGAISLLSFNPAGERKVTDGRVTESSRIICAVTEQDIIMAAEEREYELAPKQLDQVAEALEHRFSARDMVRRTLDDLGFTE